MNRIWKSWLTLNGSLLLLASGSVSHAQEFLQSLPDQSQEAISPAGQHLEELLAAARTNRELPVNEWFLGAPARALPLIEENLKTHGVTAAADAEALYLAQASGLTGNILGLVHARQKANESATKGSPSAQCRLRHEGFLAQWSLKTPPSPLEYRAFTEQTYAALMASKDLLTVQCEAQYLFNLLFRAKELSEAMPDLEEALGPQTLDVLAGLAMPENIEYWKANEALCFLSPHWPDLVNFLREQEYGPEDFCISAAVQRSAPSAYHLVTAYLDPPSAASLTDASHKTDPVILRLLEQAGDTNHLPSLDRLIAIYEKEDPEGASEGLLLKASAAGSTRAALMIARRLEALLPNPDADLKKAATSKKTPAPKSETAPDPKKVLHYYRLAAARSSTDAVDRLQALGIETNSERLQAYRTKPAPILKELKNACLQTKGLTSPKAQALASQDNAFSVLDRSLRLTASVFPLLTNNFGHCLQKVDAYASALSLTKLPENASEWIDSSAKWCELSAQKTVKQWELEESLREKGCF